MDQQRPDVPLADLHAAAGEQPEATAAIGAFAAEYEGPDPSAERLAAHADRLRSFPDLVGPFERWYLNPHVQAFIAELNATGL